MLSRSVFRDAISKLSLRKKLTILVSVGVVLPLVVLSYMQYRSLVELQTKTKGAFKDNVRQGLTAVERRMKQRLEEVATQTLDPIGGIDLSSAEEIESHFAHVKRTHPEIEEIFVFPKQPEVLSFFEKSRMAQSFLTAMGSTCSEEDIFSMRCRIQQRKSRTLWRASY